MEKVNNNVVLDLIVGSILFLFGAIYNHISGINKMLRDPTIPEYEDDLNNHKNLK